MIDVIAVSGVLYENGYPNRHSLPNNPHTTGRIDLDAGPIITFYLSGKALVQGANLDKCGNDVKSILRFCDWQVK